MKAFVLTETAAIHTPSALLELTEVPVPQIRADEILIKVSTCGVCHTELDEIEGRVVPNIPIIPGHQVIGQVHKSGSNVKRFQKGDRVGVAWIYSACRKCLHCQSGLENLCTEFMATGKDVDGGYAEFMKVHELFAFPVPAVFSDQEAAPLLCAGAIGYRALQLSGIKDGYSLGLSGFGGSGHLVIKMVRHLFPHSKVFVFARNPIVRDFALELGAVWSGDINEKCPEPLHAIIDTTPAWTPVLKGLANLRPGGRLVINAIRKEELDKESLLDFDYAHHLWMEKEVKSVANITRNDVSAFLQFAAEERIKPTVDVYPFAQANQALFDLKSKRIQGSKVLQIA